MQGWIELCSGCSGIVVYGGGDIVFGAKRSNQWMQWTQYAVDAVCSGHSYSRKCSFDTNVLSSWYLSESIK